MGTRNLTPFLFDNGELGASRNPISGFGALLHLVTIRQVLSCKPLEFLRFATSTWIQRHIDHCWTIEFHDFILEPDLKSAGSETYMPFPPSASSMPS